MDASLPPDAAVDKAVKARKGAPPPDGSYAAPPPNYWQPPPVPPIPQWTGEFGGRYWLGFGRNQLDLYDTTGSILLSRLTYTGLQSNAGEAFGRVDHISGFFVKGFAGGGAITTGNLQDEDFLLPPLTIQTPGGPVTTTYSSTNGEQRDGRLATIDAGWTWRGETSRLGFFLGYNYSHQLVNSFGCIQTASYFAECGTSPVSTSILSITDEFNWNAIRLGFNGQWRFWGGFAFDLDFAWLPHAWLDASDTHWLRSFTVPEGGVNSFASVQIDALLRYQFVNGLSVGIGARYWKFDTAYAQAFFNDSNVLPSTPFPQVISLHSEQWGPLFELRYSFGELRPSRY
jgi:hypothetical protein